MIKTAYEFKLRPGDVYRAAYKGETVTINHDRFPDVVFEIKARARNSDRWWAETVTSINDLKEGDKVELNGKILTVISENNQPNT
ncbi:hypothetical protein KAR91_53695 [Candidatus Pacearchaeota archaeon]|nr:hypothetical protein [Candidatus Pacearchaeota archaeon]